MQTDEYGRLKYAVPTPSLQPWRIFAGSLVVHPDAGLPMYKTPRSGRLCPLAPVARIKQLWAIALDAPCKALGACELCARSPAGEDADEEGMDESVYKCPLCFKDLHKDCAEFLSCSEPYQYQKHMAESIRASDLPHVLFGPCS